MRIVGLVIALTMVGCGSETKVEENLDPDGLQGPGGGGGNETTPGGVDTAGGEDTGGGGGTGATGDDDDATGDDDDDTTGNTTGSETPPDWTWTGDVPTDPTGDEICELAAALVIELDPYQTPGDGRVVYCHAGGGTNIHYIETDISSCLPHINHPGDVFPTTGCDS
jgi:hypothetical protein